jgi:hypothetical protein
MKKARQPESQKVSLAALLLVAVVALLFGGCATHGGDSHSSAPMPEVGADEIMIMSGVDLEVCLMTNGVFVERCSIVSDDLYAIPTLEWWNRNLPGIVRAAQIRDGVEPMDTRDGNDCDNLARHASNAARRWWYRQRITPQADLAIGDVSFTRDDGVPHKANIGVVRVRKGEYRCAFLEAYNATTFPTLSVWELDTVRNYEW